MVSDLGKVTEHVIQIMFHHSIVRVHVVVNCQGRLIGAWILGILSRTTSFKRRVCRDGTSKYSKYSKQNSMTFEPNLLKWAEQKKLRIVCH
jgi:hypothetical protein